MATNDLLGTLEASYALGLGTTDIATAKTGTLLATAISAVSEALVERVGPVVYSTVTGELHDGGQGWIYLDQHPVQGVVQVVEYDSTTASTLTAETNSSKPDTSYLATLTSGKIERRNGGNAAWFPVGRSNVYVTYVAGRYASTAAVGAKYKQAAVFTLKNWWRTYESQAATLNEFDVPQAAFPRFAIPNSAKDVLGKDWRAGSGTGD